MVRPFARMPYLFEDRSEERTASAGGHNHEPLCICQGADCIDEQSSPAGILRNGEKHVEFSSLARPTGQCHRGKHRAGQWG